VIQSRWSDLDQAPRELRDGGMRRAQKRRMRKAAELLGDRGIDFRDAVAKEIAPERGGPVEQPVAAIIYQVMTFGAHDDERVGGQILAHLRKRMPHMLRIPAPYVVSGWRQEGQTPFLRNS
jgi:hypothetical protein